ncbi:hypothetical protein O3M35_000824 [Rhynocoris fuscipes]|uniref:Uncharacterized protein n=1 Tax=Rhynocoris fuscipes TaxID=488301 RepID=A0AAW1DRF0_9HEMI
MSGHGKGGTFKVNVNTRSSRAGLQFPIGRIHRLLRKGNCRTCRNRSISLLGRGNGILNR